jgi:hypothetical protein
VNKPVEACLKRSRTGKIPLESSSNFKKKRETLQKQKDEYLTSEDTTAMMLSTKK